MGFYYVFMRKKYLFLLQLLIQHLEYSVVSLYNLLVTLWKQGIIFKGFAQLCFNAVISYIFILEIILVLLKRPKHLEKMEI